MTDENAVEKKLDEMQDDEEGEKGAEKKERDYYYLFSLSVSISIVKLLL